MGKNLVERSKRFKSSQRLWWRRALFSRPRDTRTRRVDPRRTQRTGRSDRGETSSESGTRRQPVPFTPRYAVRTPLAPYLWCTQSTRLYIPDLPIMSDRLDHQQSRTSRWLKIDTRSKHDALNIDIASNTAFTCRPQATARNGHRRSSCSS